MNFLNRRQSSSSEFQKAISDLGQAIIHCPNNSGIYYGCTKETAESSVYWEDHYSLPVPPSDLWHWYGKSAEEYLSWGKAQASEYRTILSRHNFCFEDYSMLDFGSSAGRVLRHFADDARRSANIWGCDIDASAMIWCEKNMSPLFSFFTNTTLPSLPFCQHSFDLIIAGSVFTHINEMRAAWLLELARCLKPNGYAVFTVTTELSIPAIISDFKKNPDPNKRVPAYIFDNSIDESLLRQYGFISFDTSPWWLAVIYHSEYFKRCLETAYEVVEIIPNAKGYQTAFVLRRAK